MIFLSNLLNTSNLFLNSAEFFLHGIHTLVTISNQLSTENNTEVFFFSFFIGIVFFTIRWWDPVFFEAMHPEGTAPRASWPYVESKSYLWTWLFLVPLAAYSLWQLLYFLIVNVLRRQRMLRDPEVMTSYRFLISLADISHKMHTPSIPFWKYILGL